MTLTLLGEPRSTSHIYHYACRGRHPAMYMTAEGKALKESYGLQARLQWRRKPLTGRLQITLTLYFGTRRKSDWDNYNKCLDALNGIVWEDDEQIQEATVIKAYDKARPRIELVINELP